MKTPLTTDSRLANHIATQPHYICEACGRSWPCRAWTLRPLDQAAREAMRPAFTRMTQQALRHLADRPGGQRPYEIVKRFLWFMNYTDDEAQAVARRLRR